MQFFFQIRNCNMLYYKLQALLQHNYNLAVVYLALVAMKAVFDEVFFFKYVIAICCTMSCKHFYNTIATWL